MASFAVQFSKNSIFCKLKWQTYLPYIFLIIEQLTANCRLKVIVNLKKIWFKTEVVEHSVHHQIYLKLIHNQQKSFTKYFAL